MQKPINQIKKEIESLKKTIRYADYRYYILSDPEISDKEYDDLLKKLKELEGKYPQSITADSPTQRVSGGIIGGFRTVRHKVKMLSLDNVYSIEELKEWENKIKRMLKKEVSLDYVAELKIDGLSCSLTYEKGVFNIGATRGDGEVGEDVTANIRTIKSIPLKLNGINFPEILEVRGEVYMDKGDFANINKVRASTGEPLFVNPRNAASGSLKLLNPSLVSQRNLKCFVHSFGHRQGGDFKNQQGFLKNIAAFGLRVNQHNKLCGNLDEVIDYCMYWQNNKESLEYEVDGVVVKVNDFILQKELGTTLKSPRWGVAYKFPAHQATTKVAKIEISVGRTGIITPVAELVPVLCGGVTISRSTLHNFDEMKRLDVRVGDTVIVERAGEVIPKIIKVITSQRTGKEKKTVVPSLCPACDGEVAKEKNADVYWYCLNPDCPAQLKRSLIHFAGRGGMDITGMGESVVEELVDRGLVKSISDIYKLKKEDLLSLPLFAKKKADNLLRALEESKNRSFSRFLYGLGIRHIGEKAAFILAQKFKKIDVFFNLKQFDLEEIPEIGNVMADSVIKFFSSPRVLQLIDEFKKSGVNLEGKETISKGSSLKDKVFIFTGELENLTRPQAEKLVMDLGGKYVASVSKNVDYVVAGKNPGSKYDKAKKLGLNIINGEEFKNLLKM